MAETMKFIWVNKRDWLRPGPIVTMTLRSAHALASLGHETHLVLGAGSESNTDDDLKNFYGLTPLPQLHIHRVHKRRFFGTELSASVYRHAAKLATTTAGSVSVLTRDAGFLPMMARLQKSGSSVRCYYEPHDFFADLAWLGKKKKFADLRQRHLERRYLPRLSGLLCIAGGQQELYRQHLPGVRSIYLPLGCDPCPPLSSEERRSKRCAVYVGHLHGSKGLYALFSAAERLRRTGHDLRFAMLGGTTEQVARSHKSAEEHGVAELFSFVPFLSPELLRQKLHAEYSIGLAPLQDTFYNQNLTCPVKVLDYLSHGLPVVGTEVRSVRETAQDAALYADPERPSELARRIRDAMNQAELHAKLSAASARRGQELSWTRRAERMVEFCTNNPRENPDQSTRNETSR